MCGKCLVGIDPRLTGDMAGFLELDGRERGEEIDIEELQEGINKVDIRRWELEIGQGALTLSTLYFLKRVPLVVVLSARSSQIAGAFLLIGDILCLCWLSLRLCQSNLSNWLR